MNELVKRLTKKQPVQANRPDKSVAGLRERIDLNYVHVLFTKTGTELGMYLDRDKCEWKPEDLEKGTGKIHLEGALTLNYDKVRCVTDIDLSTMAGTGCLSLIESDQEYNRIVHSELVR